MTAGREKEDHPADSAVSLSSSQVVVAVRISNFNS